MSDSLREQVRETLDHVRGELLGERTRDGHWVGQLSASALSTATAISAMSAMLLHRTGSDNSLDSEELTGLIKRGVQYLRDQQNEDGGFGDTDRSHSNIATSYLVLAANELSGRAIGETLSEDQRDRLGVYIKTAGEIEGLRERYGKDKTFVVPILTNLAIAGLVDWDQVAALPFEAAVFPQSMYRLMQMPVVSYAIPALVAIGQARHFHGRPALLPLRLIRKASISRTMNVLQKMQPESGGYLEAAPLTSFVVMSLAATGRGSHDVSRNGLRFLKESITGEGGWPIDTNLATWVTSLSIHALSCDPDDDGSWCSESLVNWHLGCQHARRHPFTGAEPGGWGWSDLSGAVPDSDDTPAAILALSRAAPYVGGAHQANIETATDSGRRWLLKLQNRDGGWPTFCRGWGKLPFDRSSTDLTAHAIRALRSGELGDLDSRRIDRAMRYARAFLERSQCDDGSWLPLWFGNQDRSCETNPVYGTARVLISWSDGTLGGDSCERGCQYLIEAQNDDGGWGGGASVAAWMRSNSHDHPSNLVSSVEETALAVEALATVLLSERDLAPVAGVETGQIAAGAGTFAAAGKEAYWVAIIRGVEFLVRGVREGRHHVPWPIGFYFAKLWYHEKLYPLIFTVAALGKYLRAAADAHDPDWPR